MFNIIPNRKKLEEDLDFGYIIDENKNNTNNIIFNIYNVFKID